MKFKLWLIILLFSASKLSAQTKFISSDTASYFKLMFVGDVSLTKEVLEVSYSERKQQYDFQYLFHYIRPVLNLADLVVGNVENTYGIKKDYLKNELNAAPEEFAVALKYAGFNLLMNANRTAIAQESDSWKQNRDFLESLHITQIGSFENEEDRYRRNPSIIEKNGLKVAFLNYFYGIPYYPELKPLVNGFQEDVVERDIVLAKNRGADYIIVYMNWGSEYELDANATQKKIGDFCIQAGANLVVGTHPHVVQEASVKNVKNAKGIHQTVIAYSLGDFISTTSAPLQNGACILELILKKSKASGLTSIADLSYIPTYTAMYQEGEFLRYAIMPVSQVEKANLNVPIDNT
ncbi:MAG: CapA family protein, partial [Bacteroidetes bacterium]|nr:CapA family protein [Bacteroidota bacterium]